MIAWYTKTNSQFFTKNNITLIKSGSEYFTLLLDLINKATASIHLQVYIIENDETGMLVLEALMAASKRKVQVFILADGYASQSLPDTAIQQLKDAGISFRFFAPILKSSNFYFGRRMHHKIFVADATHCLVGGINIGDRYNDTAGTKAWLDFALYAEGEVAQALCKFCMKKWERGNQKSSLANCEPNPHSKWSRKDISDIRIRRNDWVKNKNEISSTYIQLLNTSQKEVVIFCSYFLPGMLIRKVFANTVKRGVKIKVVAAGMSDVPVSKYAERWLYDWLLRNGIELYEYQPSVLHAKIGVCDEEWLTIGSYNVNQISSHASIELNLDVHNPVFVAGVKKQLLRIIDEDCIQVTLEEHLRTKNIFKQFARWCAYQFIKIAFSIFTFYFRKQG
ncbi:MAG: phospholipase D-like domain-containing protein [Bacteroidota bacterium]